MQAEFNQLKEKVDTIKALESEIAQLNEQLNDLEEQLSAEELTEEQRKKLTDDIELIRDTVIPGKESDLSALLAEFHGEDPDTKLEDLQSQLTILAQGISDISAIIDDFDTLTDEIQELENVAIPAAIADIAKINGEISALTKDISDLDTKIATAQAKITDLDDKAKALLSILANPSLGSRTGIYSHSRTEGGRHIINDKLKEIFELTREKYDKDMIFIAIHCNASGNPGSSTTASGVQVYYRDSSTNNGYTAYEKYYQNYNDNLRLKLAKSLLKHTRENTSFKGKWSTPFRKDFLVLREQNLPSVLMEIGFVNNPEDVKLLNQEQTRENAAKGMYLGIVEYFNN